MFAVIHLPNFWLQAALRPEPQLHEQPVVLLDSTATTSRVCQQTPAAAQAGICLGMTPPQAMARCAEVVIRSRSALQENAARTALLQLAYAFSPALEDTAPGICTMDLKGLPIIRSKTEKSFESWARQIVERCSELHLQARVGIAETPDLAWQAAQCARPFLVVQNAGAFLSALPIESIEPSPEILCILHKWGIRTLGEFTSLGKERVAERLNQEGVELYNRASIKAARPLRWIQFPETFEEVIEFEHEIETLEPLLFILRRFIEQITSRLANVYLVAQEFHLRLQLSSGACYERGFPVPAPTRDVDTLFRMLHTHLENLRLEHSITALRVEAKPCKASNFQFHLFDAALRDPNQFFETLARLTALLGPGRVGAPVLQQTYRPDAFHMETASYVQALQDANGRGSGVSEWEGLCFRRFRPPIGATVQMQNGRPVALRSSKASGPIQSCRGPWYLSGDWWDQKSWKREEWDVCLRNGQIYRLYQDNQQWFLEGVYD